MSLEMSQPESGVLGVNEEVEPDFVNSVSSGGDYTQEYNNNFTASRSLSSSSYLSHHDHVKSLRLEILEVEQPCQQDDLDAFVEKVQFRFGLNQAVSNNSKTLSELVGLTEGSKLLPERFQINIEQNQLECLQELENRRKKQTELLALKQEIVDLTRQCEDLKEENQAHKELCQQEIDRAKDNLQSNERKLEEYRSKEKNLEQVEIRVKANNKDLSKKLKEAKKVEQRLESWTRNHGIQFLIPEGTDAEDTNNSCGSEVNVANSIIIKLTNPDNPDGEALSIAMQYMISDSKDFEVLNVFPSNEKLIAILEEANKTKDFKKFLMDCRIEWDKYVENKGKSTEHGCNQSEVLFESPSASFKENK